jgi:putative membrane protein
MVVMMFWYGGGWPFWEVALMWAGLIVFWGLLIWAVFALVASANGRARRAGHGEGDRPGGDVRRILDERLARGEIDMDEYRRLRDELASADAPGAASSRTGR